ncbi:hypothetical protein TNCV_2362451 [Trichonephila clavipes]|nr:hypothetical protein TNCV_2362451 [Trichonephila clavipes]
MKQSLTYSPSMNARRRFVEWAQNEIAVVPDFHKRILFSDEAHFWLNGYVNKQNCRIWSEANPQVYVETPLHPEKLTVWCALWAGGIIGPYFFKNDEGHNVTVNGDRYRAMITNFFIPELNNHDVQELWFQQDGATCHTARATIDLLKDTLGYVKPLVYADKPQTLDHLEDNIRRVIADIRPQMLEKVIENWTSRLDYIRASRGSHIPEIIFKMFCILECHPGFTSVNKYFRCSRKQDSWNPLLQPCVPVGKQNTAYRTGPNNLGEAEEKDSVTETNDDESDKNNDESETEVEDARYMKFADSEEKENNDNRNQFGKEIEYKDEVFEISENTNENEKEENYGRINFNEKRKKTENENNSFVLSDIGEQKYSKNNQSVMNSKEIMDVISAFLKSKDANEKEKDSNGMNNYQYRNKFEDKSGPLVKIINTERIESNHQEINVQKGKEGESGSLLENENMEISSLQPDVSFHFSDINRKENRNQKELKGNLLSPGNFTYT